MLKHILKALLALCVVAAMSFAGTTTAHAAGGDADSTGSAERAAGPCAQQRHRATNATKASHHADKRVKKAKRAKKRAHSRHQRHAADTRLKRAKRHQRAAHHRATQAKRAYVRCRKTHGSGGNGGGGGDDTSTVVQQCQDAGLPAEVCDAVGQLPDPTGGGGDGDLAQQCVDAGLPAELCGALAQLPAPPDPADDPLCGLGLPLPICGDGLLRRS